MRDKEPAVSRSSSSYSQKKGGAGLPASFLTAEEKLARKRRLVLGTLPSAVTFFRNEGTLRHLGQESTPGLTESSLPPPKPGVELGNSV
jgi:hypothetical protein